MMGRVPFHSLPQLRSRAEKSASRRSTVGDRLNQPIGKEHFMPRAFVLSLMGLVVMSVAFFAFTATPPLHAVEVGAVEPQKTSTFVGAAATFEMYKDKAGEYRWRLRTQNTKV